MPGSRSPRGRARAPRSKDSGTASQEKRRAVIASALRSLCLPVSVPVILPACLLVSLSDCVAVCLSICLFVCLSVGLLSRYGRLSVGLSVSLWVCLLVAACAVLSVCVFV